ncbi:hypothetical protein [Microbacterium paludicola]|uniref:hypothetical protein n=1 Tax=Microbacterium paludicola TaxID=300019 RepID=UPI0031DE6EA7
MSRQKTPNAITVAHSITAFLRNLSTRVPKSMLNSEMNSMYAPPMTPVAMTLRVSA